MAIKVIMETEIHKNKPPALVHVSSDQFDMDYVEDQGHEICIGAVNAYDECGKAHALESHVFELSLLWDWVIVNAEDDSNSLLIPITKEK
jgi:hypothetical protein